MLLHDDVVADIQTQAGPLARSFGGEEGVKQTALDLLLYAWTVVFDLDDGPLAVGPRADGDPETGREKSGEDEVLYSHGLQGLP